MGYYTNYRLDNISPSGSEIAVPEDVSYKDILEEFFEGQDMEECKWYDHVDDMLKVSLVNPDVKFETSGVGEENGDQWKAVFLNGKYKKVLAKIVFDDFDEVEWKDV